MDGGWPGLTGWIFGRFCGNLRGGNATVTARLGKGEVKWHSSRAQCAWEKIKPLLG